MVRSGESVGQALLARRAMGPGERGAPDYLVVPEIAQSTRQVWGSDVLGPLTEAAELLKGDAAGLVEFASAYQRLRQALEGIRSVSDRLAGTAVDSSVLDTVVRLFRQIMMLGRGLQPFIGKKTDYADIVDEAGIVEGTASELLPAVSVAVPTWSEAVVKPIGEAVATIKGEAPAAGGLAAAREKLFLAGRKVRAIAAEEEPGSADLDHEVRMKLWHFYMQVTMLERALHPDTGSRMEVSRIKDEAAFAQQTAAGLAAELP
jgi:hypothetical protein